MLRDSNHQAVLALLPDACPVLYTPASGDDSGSELASLVAERLAQLLGPLADNAGQQDQQQQKHQKQQMLQPHSPHAEVALAAGLSRALCYTHRYAERHSAGRRRGAPPPRILCLVRTADTPLQYIPIMNAIFAAQRTGVVVDACVVGGADSAFLQQAAHLTGGVYLRATRPAALLQQLLGGFVSDSCTRRMLALGGWSSAAVDYRASCFCHKTVIDTGYVCSVCLSIFCKANMRLQACPTCGSAFKQQARKGGGGAAGSQAGGGAGGSGTDQAQQQELQLASKAAEG
jgi:transcription initiation factor TFIIH subunit 3